MEINSTGWFHGDSILGMYKMMPASQPRSFPLGEAVKKKYRSPQTRVLALPYPAGGLLCGSERASKRNPLQATAVPLAM